MQNVIIHHGIKIRNFAYGSTRECVRVYRGDNGYIAVLQKNAVVAVTGIKIPKYQHDVKTLSALSLMLFHLKLIDKETLQRDQDAVAKKHQSNEINRLKDLADQAGYRIIKLKPAKRTAAP